ncbi:MAG: glycosyltransferase family 39 protein [Candidatus Shapirobacteria bacterium]|nr:glycosyltransferase family 39 protein [Candidatus Shapirobacteria bacterium]
MKTKIILILIFIFGFTLRLCGLNWDQGQHLHPDERFLTMVSSDISLPKTISEYLNPQTSSLNPYNRNYSFYVYGSFPISLVRIIAESFHLADYNHIYLVGRYLALILDSLIIILIFYTSRKITNSNSSLIASFLYAICVLPIQLSHFFTVDPFLNFFIFLCFYFLLQLHQARHPLRTTILLSISFSFALASKISAVYFSPVILLGFIFTFKKNFKLFFKYGFIFLIATILIFRFSQPQVFTDSNYLHWTINPQFVSNLNQLKKWDKNPYFPPAIQWIKVIPIIFPLKNIIFWGLGLPFGFIFLTSFFFICFNFKSFSQKSNLFLVLFWIVFLFIFQGVQAVSTMRYFLPIYPFICIVSAVLINLVLNIKFIKTHLLLKLLILTPLIVYPLMFLSIFLKDHTRLSASLWIYKNVPYGSVIATEYWDDALPISVGQFSPSSYQNQSIHIADVEETDPSKINKIKQQLNQSDYYILSSNRFYKPIPENSDLFPETTKFYQSLFNGSLGFNKIAEFSSYPCFPPIGKSWFCFNDDQSEEAFTVHDHPKIIIFEKSSRNSR